MKPGSWRTEWEKQEKKARSEAREGPGLAPYLLCRDKEPKEPEL